MIICDDNKNDTTDRKSNKFLEIDSYALSYGVNKSKFIHLFKKLSVCHPMPTFYLCVMI